jgi:ATP-dependent DNA ligase
MHSICSGWMGWNLRDKPLLERKLLLRRLLPRRPKSVLYVDHVTNGTELFQVICEQDMEGVVAKQATAKYTPDATTWVKIQNRHYSQGSDAQIFSTAPKYEGRTYTVPPSDWRHSLSKSGEPIPPRAE